MTRNGFVMITILLVTTFLGFAQDKTQNVPKSGQKTEPIHQVKVTYGPSVQSVTDTTAFITWSTNVNAETILHYGTSSGNLDHVEHSPSTGTTHGVKLNHLSPDTTYYYRIETSATQSAEPMSGVPSFRTKASKAK